MAKKKAVKRDGVKKKSVKKIRKIKSIGENLEDDYEVNKGLYWVIGIALGVLLAFVVVGLIARGLNTFDYEGLEFTKEKFGELDVYRHSYWIDQKTFYNMYLRIDPRDNTAIITGNDIAFSSKSPIYISIDGSDLAQCEYSSVAVGSLAAFLSNNGLGVIGATTNETYAIENNLTFADCETMPKDQVIMIQTGNVTKVDINGRCYTISAANCEILDAVEAFEIQSVIEAKR